MKNLKKGSELPGAFLSLNTTGKDYLFFPVWLLIPKTKSLFILSATFTIVALLSSPKLLAQNSPPFWSVEGNNNAPNSAKLGTTNLVPLRFFTNNQERMRIDVLGNVGIGNTNPVNILTVQSGGGSPASSWLNGLNSPVFMGFADNVSSEFVLAAASNTSSSRPVIQGRRARGSLTSPAAVINDDYLSSFLASGYDGSTFQNPATISFFVDSTPSAGNVPARISFVTGSNTANREERLKIGSSGNFNFNNNQFTVTRATGNIGIGTANPKNKFQIGTAPGFSGNDIFIGNGTKGMSFFQSPIASIWYTSANFVLMPAAGGAGNVGIGTATPINKLQIGTAPGFSGNDIFIGNGTKGMSFFQSPNASIWYTSANFVLMPAAGGEGNVGIGTATPTHKLSVNGSIRAKEIRVESGWSDYVFEKDYALRSLDNVAKYIAQNKHLPGIPSAKDIQENGLAVGEVQTKMMAKIEELTLYIIKQEKSINDLKEQNARLETKMNLLDKKGGK